jgi:hypothetical protein
VAAASAELATCAAERPCDLGVSTAEILTSKLKTSLGLANEICEHDKDSRNNLAGSTSSSLDFGPIERVVVRVWAPYDHIARLLPQAMDRGDATGFMMGS